MPYSCAELGALFPPTADGPATDFAGSFGSNDLSGLALADGGGTESGEFSGLSVHPKMSMVIIPIVQARLTAIVHLNPKRHGMNDQLLIIANPTDIVYDL